MTKLLCDAVRLLTAERHGYYPGQGTEVTYIGKGGKPQTMVLCEDCAASDSWTCDEPDCGSYLYGDFSPVYAWSGTWCELHSLEVELIISNDERDKIIEQSLAAWKDILTGVDETTRRRMIAAIIGRINAHARGDVEAADEYRRITFLDLKTAQRIAEGVAIKRALKIAGIVASVAATQLPAVAGAIVGAVAAFITQDVEDSNDGN